MTDEEDVMTENPSNRRRSRRLSFALIALAAAALTVLVLFVWESVVARKAEAHYRTIRVVEVDETTEDPALWGQNWPPQYDSYLRTVDTKRTRHGGSEAFQRLDDFPVYQKLFAGYAFSIDYREDRGHAYMLSDQRGTRRVTERPQPGTCLHCHASVVPAYRALGLELGAPGAATDPLLSPTGRAQLEAGFAASCRMPYSEATERVEHPVSCIDCHDPETMRLRVTRPGFLDGIASLAASDEQVRHFPSIERWREGNRDEPYDPNAEASRHEMRSMVCGQCHVEYYFRPKDKRLIYPWSHGLTMEAQERHYEEAGFADWVHAQSASRMLKAQHPEFEMWSQGAHAAAGVSCADCHMPYERSGATKFSNHHVRSPLLDVSTSCQVCHRRSESDLLAGVKTIQDRTRRLMDRAEQLCVEVIEAIASAAEAGADDALLAEARRWHRSAQWRLDWVAAENSMGLHARQEAARILAEAIDHAHRAKAVVANH